LPWLESGSTNRSSYDLLGLVSRVGIAPDGIASALIRWWPVVPLVVTVGVVSAWWRQAGMALVAAGVAALYTGSVGGTLALSSQRSGVEVGVGPWVSMTASVAFVVTAAWVAVTRASDRGLRTPVGARPVDRS